MALIAEKAASVKWLTSRRRGAPADSADLQRAGVRGTPSRGQIVPLLVDRGLFIGSERSFTGSCKTMSRPIAEKGQGCPRNSYPRPGYGLMAPTRSGPSPVK